MPKTENCTSSGKQGIFDYGATFSCVVLIVTKNVVINYIWNSYIYILANIFSCLTWCFDILLKLDCANFFRYTIVQKFGLSTIFFVFEISCTHHAWLHLFNQKYSQYSNIDITTQINFL